VFKFVWQGYADKHKDEALNLQLVKVQIFLSQGNVYGACDALKALGDLQYKPGVVSGKTTMKTLSIICLCNEDIGSFIHSDRLVTNVCARIQDGVER
jgi:hypothetical protein